VTLTRMDCGSGANDPRRFSDSFAYTETTKPFTFSCYVIKHGADHSWCGTRGYLPGSVPNATNKPLVDLLKQINVQPDQVKFVGISHFHADHTGQLAPFANATLLIGKGDWDGINATPPMVARTSTGSRSGFPRSGKLSRRARTRMSSAMAASSCCARRATRPGTAACWCG